MGDVFSDQWFQLGQIAHWFFLDGGGTFYHDCTTKKSSNLFDFNGFIRPDTTEYASNFNRTKPLKCSAKTKTRAETQKLKIKRPQGPIGRLVL